MCVCARIGNLQQHDKTCNWTKTNCYHLPLYTRPTTTIATRRGKNVRCDRLDKQVTNNYSFFSLEWQFIFYFCFQLFFLVLPLDCFSSFSLPLLSGFGVSVLGVPGDVLHACTFMDDVHVYADVCSRSRLFKLGWSYSAGYLVCALAYSVCMAPYLACTAFKLPPPPLLPTPLSLLLLLMSPVPSFSPMLLSSSSSFGQ